MQWDTWDRKLTVLCNKYARIAVFSKKVARKFAYNVETA
jgi:hypothetical protein